MERDDFENKGKGVVRIPLDAGSLMYVKPDGVAHLLELRHCFVDADCGNPLLDNSDLMRITKYSARTLQRFRTSGLLAYEKCGNRIYYRLEDVERFFNERFKRVENGSSRSLEGRCGEDPALQETLMALSQMKPINRFSREARYFKCLTQPDDKK